MWRGKGDEGGWEVMSVGLRVLLGVVGVSAARAACDFRRQVLCAVSEWGVWEGRGPMVWSGSKEERIATCSPLNHKSMSRADV